MAPLKYSGEGVHMRVSESKAPSLKVRPMSHYKICTIVSFCQIYDGIFMRDTDIKHLPTIISNTDLEEQQGLGIFKGVGVALIFSISVSIGR